MLTPKQQELLSFIHNRLEEGGVSPSFEEMKDALDLRSKSGIHRLINALEERGFIRRLPNRARALEVLKLPDAMHRTPAPSVAPRPKMPATLPIAANDVIEIPLHGRIAAGVPIEAMEGQTMLPVPAPLLWQSRTSLRSKRTMLSAALPQNTAPTAPPTSMPSLPSMTLPSM